MKKQLPSPVDATPKKRIYWSIVSDYSLKLGITELVDNSIDSWIRNGQQNDLEINIELDFQRNRIIITDNAGGIPEKDISVIVSPGETSNEINAQTIGIFGVGSKRAVVYLSEDTKIFTRFGDGKTILVEVNDSWISTDSWELPIYEDDENIEESSTRIELNTLRGIALNEEEEELLRNHLSATYAKIIEKEGIIINLNEKAVDPKFFNVWSYPPEFSPRNYFGKKSFKIQSGHKEVKFDIEAGLAGEGEPANQEYGVYFYCNDRLVGRAVKDFEVGFSKGKIGAPHPSIMLTRILVDIKGDSDVMPWNSSKSGINYNNPVFREVQEIIVSLGTNYSKISKHFSSEEGWKKEVFPHKTGEIERIPLDLTLSKPRLYLPPIPRKTRVKFSAQIIQLNKELKKSKPWTVGPYEALIAVDLILKQNSLSQKNRLALLILDSTLEIAFKDFLAHDIKIGAQKFAGIVNNRADIQRMVAEKSTIEEQVWDRIDYYYKMRCELVHKRSSVNIPDDDVKNYWNTVCYCFEELFGLNIPDGGGPG